MPFAFILMLLSMSFTNPKPLFHSSNSGIRMQEGNHSDTVRIKFSPEAQAGGTTRIPTGHCLPSETMYLRSSFGSHVFQTPFFDVWMCA